MARIIMLLSGIIVAVIAVPAYMLLCLWITICDDVLKHHNKRRTKDDLERNLDEGS